MYGRAVARAGPQPVLLGRGSVAARAPGARRRAGGRLGGRLGVGGGLGGGGLRRRPLGSCLLGGRLLRGGLAGRGLLRRGRVLLRSGRGLGARAIRGRGGRTGDVQVLALGVLRGVAGDRKSVVEGKSVSVRLDLGCRRIIQKKKQKQNIS